MMPSETVLDIRKKREREQDQEKKTARVEIDRQQ
jgi:hypothetical protein